MPDDRDVIIISRATQPVQFGEGEVPSGHPVALSVTPRRNFPLYAVVGALLTVGILIGAVVF